mmetsp:Transcript_17098/g.55924  ORF Transcript_17098/g.55924 Transcript_17098/m.55924 type:complete len:225 (-) Transcript_17098:182-856(-)
MSLPALTLAGGSIVGSTVSSCARNLPALRHSCLTTARLCKSKRAPRLELITFPQHCVLKYSFPGGRETSPRETPVGDSRLKRKVVPSTLHVPGSRSNCTNDPTPSGLHTPPSRNSTAIGMTSLRPEAAHDGGIHVPFSRPILRSSCHLVPTNAPPSGGPNTRRTRGTAHATPAKPSNDHSTPSRTGCSLLRGASARKDGAAGDAGKDVEGEGAVSSVALSDSGI